MLLDSLHEGSTSLAYVRMLWGSLNKGRLHLISVQGVQNPLRVLRLGEGFGIA